MTLVWFENIKAQYSAITHCTAWQQHISCSGPMPTTMTTKLQLKFSEDAKIRTHGVKNSASLQNVHTVHTKKIYLNLSNWCTPLKSCASTVNHFVMRNKTDICYVIKTCESLSQMLPSYCSCRKQHHYAESRSHLLQTKNYPNPPVHSQNC